MSSCLWHKHYFGADESFSPYLVDRDRDEWCITFKVSELFFHYR